MEVIMTHTYGLPDVLIEDVEQPLRKVDEVLIKVHASVYSWTRFAFYMRTSI